jgi:hypothetical protein
LLNNYRSKIIAQTMKLIAACATFLLTTIAYMGVAKAENAPPIGSFSGGGYSVQAGVGGDYVGRDPQGRKLFIPYAQSSHSGKTIQWKNKGYIYRLTGIGNSLAGPKAGGIDPEDSTDYRQVSLKIISPNGRVILSKTLNNPYYGRK